MSEWYNITNYDDVDSPALLVFPDRVDQNIAHAIAMVGDVDRLRPHVKTHKTPQILQMQIEGGISKFKCATIAEAEMLGEGTAPDVLLAYPLYGPKILRFLELQKKFSTTRYSVVVDNQRAALALNDVALSARSKVDVYVDLDLGMGRTGVLPTEAAADLYQFCHRLEGLDVKGFHGYDGHVREVDLKKRKAICAENFIPVKRLSDTLISEGFERPRLVIGGSPSFPVYAAYPDLEVSPGTFVFWDKGYEWSLPEQNYQHAAVLLCRVISIIGQDRVCVDLGYKAVASENPLEKRVHFLDSRIVGPVAQSEEHLVLEVSKDHGFTDGEVLYAIPYHICPTVALFDYLTVVQDGRAMDRWEVAARRR